MMSSHFQVPKSQQIIFALGVLAVTPILSGAAAPSSSPPAPPPAMVTSPFTIVAPPYPSVSWPTMAIVPTRPVSPAQAAQIASFARKQISPSNAKRWKGLNIHVFSNMKAAQTFKAYQDKLWGRPLKNADYARLAPLWPKALAFYKYSQGQEKVIIP
jgi:hypothetical protein